MRRRLVEVAVDPRSGEICGGAAVESDATRGDLLFQPRRAAREGPVDAAGDASCRTETFVHLTRCAPGLERGIALSPDDLRQRALGRHNG